MKDTTLAPYYAIIWLKASELAKDSGYALALLGSMTRDLDLVAIPWRIPCAEPDDLAKRIADNFNLEMDSNGRGLHGKLYYAFKGFGDVFVDLKVIPPISNAEAKETA